MKELWIIKPSKVRPGKFNIYEYVAGYGDDLREAGFPSIAAAMNYGALYLWASDKPAKVKSGD